MIEYTHVSYWEGRKALEDGEWSFLDEVNADIGIQHYPHENGRFRFCMDGCLRPFSIKSGLNFLRFPPAGSMTFSWASIPVPCPAAEFRLRPPRSELTGNPHRLTVPAEKQARRF